MHSRRCPQCNATFSLGHKYCQSCGADLPDRTSDSTSDEHFTTDPQKKSQFEAFGFHSRWFILVIILAMAVSFFNLYLHFAVLAAYIVFIIMRNKLSVNAFIGKLPSNYNWWPLILMALGAARYWCLLEWCKSCFCYDGQRPCS